jgi:hypothetical protein
MKPVFVEVFVSDLAVEISDVNVLHGATWWNQDEKKAMGLCNDPAESAQVKLLI